MTLKSFATVEDYEERYGALSDVEKGQVAAVIGDMSVKLAIHMKQSGVAIDSSNELQAAALRVVTLECSHKAFKDRKRANLTNYTQSAGGYSETMTFANSSGELWLSKEQKSMLGLGKSRIFAIRPNIGGGAGD